MSDGMFETPNTRSRRKREGDAMTSGSSGSAAMGSQEDERVVWVHDQRLRRAVLSATEHVELAPPTPTQRPRPISSSRPAGSSSSRPPRKRPCRTSRSDASVSTGKTKQGSTSSLPNKQDGEIKLDQLLQRFELFATPLGPSRARSSLPSAPLATRGVAAGILTDQTLKTNNVANPNTSSPVTRSSTSASLDKQLLVAESPAARARISVDSPLKARTVNRNNTAAPIRQAQKPFPTGQQKPFRPPFLNPNPPTRSSPRHLRTNNTIPPSPLRASIAVPSFPSSTRHAPPPVDHVAETPCREKVRKHNANVDIGEDDPAGDSSFDSFDGLFQGGGPEIEELLKTVDGSQ